MTPENAVFFLPVDEISGVTRVNLGLAHYFQEQGIKCSFYWTDSFQNQCPSHIEGIVIEKMCKPIPRKRFGSNSLGFRHAQKKVASLLKSRLGMMEKTIIFPGYDISTAHLWRDFGTSNRVVFIVHSDDPFYYEALRGDCHNANYIVTVSKHLKERLEIEFPQLKDHITYISNGIQFDTSSYTKTSLSQGPLRILYAGRLEQEQKQIFDIPEIMYRLHKAGVGFHLDIAGEGPDQNVFQRMCKDRLISSNYTFHGRLTHKRILELMSDSHIYLSTSAYEGLSISLLEAVSKGCIPVISNIDSGNSEVVTDGITGFLIDVNDLASYTQALINLASNFDELKMLSISIRNQFEHSSFTSEKMGESYIKLLENE